MSKLLFSLSIIAIGLIIGYLIQRLASSNIIKVDKTLKKQRKILQSIALLLLNPIATIGAIWDFSFDNSSIILLPFVGFFTVLCGGFIALLTSRILKLEKKQAGAFFSCGGMTNIGAIGALIVYIFLGEKAFALVPIYKIFEPLIYYSLWFPIAKTHSTLASDKSTKNNFSKVFLDPFILVTLFSIILGFVLNFLHIPRPEIYSIINSIIIPLMSILLLTSIGMAMKFSRIKDYIKPSIFISIIKFLIVPFLATTLAYILGFNNIDNGLPIKVVLILSSMPVGFIALVPPSIYDLDIDLANAGWMVTTSLLIIVIPLQMLIISIL
ncbi:MAG: AEC family transporter [Pleomorphochaeta sp.]